MSRKTATAAAAQGHPRRPSPPERKDRYSSVRRRLSIPDTTLAINSDKPMSQRVVHYEIDAKYDAAKHTVDATEVLTYHNLTGQALDHFPFHLYQNAFQPKATFVRDAKLMGSRDTGYDKWEDKYYGSENIKSLEVVGQGDLTSQLQFIAPDDGNKDDKTVVDLSCRSRSRPAHTSSSRSPFRPSCPKRRRAPDGSAISCSAASGFRRSACGGTERGIAISITTRLSSSPTSASTT